MTERLTPSNRHQQRREALGAWIPGRAQPPQGQPAPGAWFAPPTSAEEWAKPPQVQRDAFAEWLGHVEAGRIGGKDA